MLTVEERWRWARQAPHIVVGCTAAEPELELELELDQEQEQEPASKEQELDRGGWAGGAWSG